MQDCEIRKTERLIYCTAQYITAARESLVFKRKNEPQSQLLVNFIGSSGALPKRGSEMEVTYYFGNDGMFHGVKMLPTENAIY